MEQVIKLISDFLEQNS